MVAVPAGRRERAGARGRAGRDQAVPRREPAVAPGEFAEPRIYRPRARRRWRLALVTGLIAFAVAAARLTLSELLLDGAVAHDDRTTLFGGADRDERERDTAPSEGSEQDRPAPEGRDPAQDETPAEGAPTETTPAPTQPTEPPATTPEAQPTEPPGQRGEDTARPTTPSTPAPGPSQTAPPG